MVLLYILNQIPNTTSNTFLNNPKPTECRLIPFKPGYINMFAIQFSSLNNLRDFLRAYSLFVLWYPLLKSHKKEGRKLLTVFNFVLIYANVSFLSFISIFDFKVVKSIKMEQHLLKNGQSHDAKNKRFSMNGYHSIYTVDLTSMVSNY